MRNLNRKSDDLDSKDAAPIEDAAAQGGDVGKTDVTPEKGNKYNRIIANVMGGDIFSKDGFVNLFPFFLYVVLLLMVYITNIYIAEDVSRDIEKTNRRVEDLHVEYVYLKSEITKITKQSNMANMLKDKGIKESVDPLRKIVVEKKGGCDED